MPNVTPFILVISLSAAQFLSDRINIERSRYRQHVISFAAAIAITYLLFDFLPRAYRTSSGMALYIPLIAGFTIIHFLEKSFYSRYSERFSIKLTKTFHDELHAFILFLYHFVIGATLVGIAGLDTAAGILFLPPLLLFTTIGNWSLHHTYLKQIPHLRLLLASSTLFGALFASSTMYTQFIEHALINFTAGILLFIVVRESLPKPKEGKPKIFIAGIILYGVLIYLLDMLPV